MREAAERERDAEGDRAKMKSVLFAEGRGDLGEKERKAARKDRSYIITNVCPQVVHLAERKLWISTNWPVEFLSSHLGRALGLLLAKFGTIPLD